MRIPVAQTVRHPVVEFKHPLTEMAFGNTSQIGYYNEKITFDCAA
jgi:hypothetical protein